MHRVITPSLHPGLPDTPPENIALQRLIERAEDAANALEGIGNKSQILELAREHEGFDRNNQPYIRWSAIVRLSLVYSRTGTEQELRDAVVDELCSMFNLKRK